MNALKTEIGEDRTLQRLQALGISLPEPPGRAGLYTQCRLFGENMVYLSGCGPQIAGTPCALGQLGGEVSIEEGQAAARACMINALAILKKNLGSLDRIDKMVKMLAFVASRNDFYQQPLVADGASRTLVDIFGEEAGCAARSAIGVNVLPGNIPVEIELLLTLKA